MGLKISHSRMVPVRSYCFRSRHSKGTELFVSGHEAIVFYVAGGGSFICIDSLANGNVGVFSCVVL